ncbi:anthrone oxygenase family protein [Cryptosporangium minutisporangium]|uniref:DUF1772 domain-containing protein n=1 Tax=Cryptosporangium minutisporangium TaxID=113569 RepID=A0ABP6T517_9ACTN
MTLTAPAVPVAQPATPGRARRLARGWSLIAATLTTGLIAGFFYAYASSVMVGLARVDDRTFISSMQWINATVRNWWFAPSFFGALALTAVAAALHLRRDARPVLPWILGAFLLYGAAFAMTMGINVPLNDELAAAGDPTAIADPAAIRAAYEDRWNTWNVIRTVASLGALACLVRALILHGRRTAA